MLHREALLRHCPGRELKPGQDRFEESIVYTWPVPLDEVVHAGGNYGAAGRAVALSDLDGGAVHNPWPLMMMKVPPLAGPDRSLSAVTFGRPDVTYRVAVPVAKPSVPVTV